MLLPVRAGLADTALKNPRFIGKPHPFRPYLTHDPYVLAVSAHAPSPPFLFKIAVKNALTYLQHLL
jgi:hypothetical protein